MACLCLLCEGPQIGLVYCALKNYRQWKRLPSGEDIGFYYLRKYGVGSCNNESFAESENLCNKRY
jgi:hypothetical protein